MRLARQPVLHLLESSAQVVGCQRPEGLGCDCSNNRSQGLLLILVALRRLRIRSGYCHLTSLHQVGGTPHLAVRRKNNGPDPHIWRWRPRANPVDSTVRRGELALSRARLQKNTRVRRTVMSTPARRTNGHGTHGLFSLGCAVAGGAGTGKSITGGRPGAHACGLLRGAASGRPSGARGESHHRGEGKPAAFKQPSHPHTFSLLVSIGQLSITLERATNKGGQPYVWSFGSRVGGFKSRHRASCVKNT